MDNDVCAKNSIRGGELEATFRRPEQNEDDTQEMRQLGPLKSDDNHRGATKLRRTSQTMLPERSEKDSFPQSKTWEECLASNSIVSAAQTDPIYENNDQRSGDDRFGVVNDATINPPVGAKAGAMITVKQNTSKRPDFCPKCCQKRRQSSDSDRVKISAKESRKMFKSVRSFVTCLSLLQLVQVLGSGYSKSALTSIERRYRLSTFQVGVLQSCFHFGNLSVILFVSYFGSKWHRPRAIAIGSLLMTVSSLLSAMPQFVGSRYRVEESDNLLSATSGVSASLYSNDAWSIVLNNTYQPSRSTKLCSPGIVSGVTTKPENPKEVPPFHVSSQKDTNQEQEVSHLKNADTGMKQDFTENEKYWNDSNMYLFIAFGSILKGMGHSPLHPLGMSFVDDFATPRNSAVYIGVVSALSLLGPAFGFILGSLTTGTWVDWGWVDSSEIKIGPHHPLWVGAWWLGYIVTAALLLMATVPFWMFKRELPKEKEDETTEASCFRCVTRSCCNERARHDADLEQSDLESLDRDIDNAKEKPDSCAYEVAVSNLRFSHCKGDELSPDNNLNDGDAILNAAPDFDKTQTTKLITYLERPGQCDANVRTDATPCEIPFGLGKMTLPPSRSHSLTSRLEFAMTKSASEPAVECKLMRSKIKRNSDARIMSSARRPSRLEKMALLDFTASLKGLLTDTVFLSITLAFVCLTSFLAASVTYISKYMETQFSVTASIANLLNGSVNLPMAVVGNLLGGWLIRRFDLDVRRTMAVVVTGLTLTIVCLAALLFFKCNLGSDVKYSFRSDGGNCSSSCNCGDLHVPVCDVTTSITYRSPCHAGCTEVGSRPEVQYSGCRCTNRGQLTNDSGNAGVLIHGPCQRPDCSASHLPVFLGIMGTASLTAGLASTPSSLIVLRIVPPAEKAFAIGIVFVFTRILAWIPAPVYVGYVIDSACLRWSNIGRHDATKDEGHHCEIYDKDRLRKNFFAATGGLLVLSLSFYILAFYLQTNRSRIRRRRSMGRPRIVNFDSPLVSNKSPERTSSVTSPSRHERLSVTSEARRTEEVSELGKKNEKDGKLKNCLALNDDKFVLKSASENPFRIMISLSAPALASQTCETKISNLLP